MIQGILFLALCIAAVDDLLNRSVHLSYIAAFFVGAVISQILCPRISLSSAILGVLFSAALYLINILCGKAMGEGDVFVLALCGAYLGIMDSIILFYRAIMIAGGYGLWLITRDYIKHGKARKKMTLPFVPCLLLSYVSMVFVP